MGGDLIWDVVNVASLSACIVVSLCLNKITFAHHAAVKDLQKYARIADINITVILEIHQFVHDAVESYPRSSYRSFGSIFALNR